MRRGVRLFLARSGRRRSPLDKQVLERQVRICKAFASTVRLHILDLLGEGEWAISGLQHELGITKPNLSQHLAILKAAGIVSARREGKHIYCSISMPEIKRVCQLIRAVLRAQIRRGHKLAV